ncbi:MAG: hypothetical protein SNJ83_07655 [Aggregatilineales bacterium]
MRSQLVIPEDQIPNWIRSANRGLDWGGLIVALVALLVSVPYWSSGFITPENDSIHLAFRAHDTTISLREGTLYPRWSPHAVYGYGAPILHFSPPLASYGAALLTLLFTDHITTSIGLLMSAALVLGGTATYAYILQHLGARAAFAGALAFVLSPALSWLLLYHLGDLPSLLAAGLLPVFIWALDRALRFTSALDLPLVAAVFALMLLCDPHLYTPLALTFGVGACALRLNAIQQLWPKLLLALLIGMSLSAFYWLPAALEAGSVNWQQLPISPTAVFQLPALVAPFHTPDPAAGTPLMQPTVGMALAVLMSAALGLQLLTRRLLPFGLVWSIAALAVAVVLLTMQRPSLSAALAWCMALVGAVLFAALRTDQARRVTFIVALVGVATAYVPVLLALQRETPPFLFNEQGQLQFEMRGHGIAGSPSGASIPSQISLMTPPSPALLTAYTRGLPDRLTLLNGTPDKAVLLRVQAQASIYTIASASPLNAQFTINPFIGWQATLDAAPIELTPLRDAAGYVFSLPPTRGGELRIRLGMTSARQTGGLISLAGLAALILLWRWQHRRKDWQATFPPLLTPDDLRRMAAVAVTLSIALIALLSGRFVSLPTPMPGVGLISSTPLPYASSSPLQLIAYDISDYWVDRLVVTLHWRASRPLNDLLFISSSLISTTGEVVTESPPTPLSRIPTTAWRTDRYYTTHLWIDAGAVPANGRYTLTLRVFPCPAHGVNCATNRALTFFDERGVSLGTQITLPRILTR